MSAQNIQFHDKIRKKLPQIFVFWSYQKNFVGTKNKFESSMVIKPSLFELLGFDCIWKKKKTKTKNKHLNWGYETVQLLCSPNGLFFLCLGYQFPHQHPPSSSQANTAMSINSVHF